MRNDINHVFARVSIDALFECVVTRAAPPCPPIAIALRLELLGVKSIRARVRSVKTVRALSRRYVKRLDAPLHMDVSPAKFLMFRSAVNIVYILRFATCATAEVPERPTDDCNLARPTSLFALEVRLNDARKSACASSKRSVSRHLQLPLNRIKVQD